MRRGLSIAAVVLLVGVGVLGLAGCTQAVPTRTPSAVQAESTPPGDATQTAMPTPRPGETVVTVYTPVPQTSPAKVTPTQDLEDLSTPAPTKPPKPPKPTATPGGTADEPVIHIVQPGETLYSIAAHYDTTVKALADANNIEDPDSIYVGQRLIIPDGTGSSPPPSGGCRIHHTVQEGEWIWQIARDYDVSPYAILEANGLSVESGNNIKPGQVLCIP